LRKGRESTTLSGPNRKSKVKRCPNGSQTEADCMVEFTN